MKGIGQTRVEWILLGFIAVVCVVLSFLQYRWTGDLSRAEPALLRAGLNEQVHRLGQSFNEEIRENLHDAFAGRGADQPGRSSRSSQDAGIPDAECERIFEPFYRGVQTRAQRIPGAGLGLSLVKNTIERHNGTIKVRTLPEEGLSSRCVYQPFQR